MDLGTKLTLATAPSSQTGEAEYLIGDVEKFEEEFGFIVFDGRREPVMQSLYADRSEAERAREAMFVVLRNCVGLSPAP